MDTGTTVSVANLDVYKRQFRHKTIYSSNKILKGTTSNHLAVVGAIMVEIILNGTDFQLEFRSPNTGQRLARRLMAN